ncbi:MAG: sigma 54-interacting transcriptional regulator [Deltaproteobacteria bacterium]|jgi:two-component system NtrC family response regulator|nr:sigma 54-interacting transcriptional regulator [Deltaproteobacteria bacterium]
MTATILVVDDEPNYRMIIGQLLESSGYDVVQAGSGREALDLFRESPEMDLVMTDITMPDGDGMELLTKVKAERNEVPVVMLTAHNDTKLAVEAIKKGAFDYLTKPYLNEDLLRCAAKALELSSLARQNKELKEALSQRHSFSNIIGKSKPMVELYQLLEKVAPTKANVLITGESGTGKEVVAKAIHHNSPRVENAFVAVNCSALSESLLVSELFGYEKGAYTGAGPGRAGRFELANKGTLFLDEIGEMGPSTQVTLLRVLQERALERVGGGGKLIELDVRLITATNRDLKAEVRARRFREDLFFRLNVVHINLPPLRDRMEDLPILVEHFLDKYGRERRIRPTLNPETLRLLYAHAWPGNVRELENVIERGLVLCAGNEIMPTDLPEELQRPSAVPIPPTSPPAAPQPAFPGDSPQSQGDPLDRTAPPTPAGPPGEAPKAPAPAGNPQNASPAGPWGQGFIGTAIDLIPEGMGLKDAISAMEEAMVRKSMDLGNGVQSRAADLLGLRPNVFKYKWDKYVDEAPTEFSGTLADVIPDGGDLVAILEDFEQGILKKALTMADGVHNRAADILGLKRNVMPYKLKKYPGLISFSN